MFCLMIAAPSASDAAESLPAFLAREARRASDGQLAVGATFGAIVAAVALLWRPGGFVYFLCSGLSCGAFGAWGIADRQLAELGAAGTRTASLLRAARFACGLVGTLAAAGLLVRVLFIGLGTWIS